MSELKQKLLQACQELVGERIATINRAMENAQAAANQETKSSAGDKYETGRAMMQLEKEKLTTQLGEASKMKRGLDQINPDKDFDQVALGALVITAQASYFISVSVGKVEVDGKTYFAISPVAPIGQQLLNKRVGDQISFAGRAIQIKEIS